MEERTLERLKQLQALPLERKVGFTIARLTEFYHHFDGKVYVSFSGGKDSTVLLYIARKLFPDIKAVFVDTGLEYPEIRDFVKTWDNVDWIKPQKSFYQVIKEYGYPVVSKEVAGYIWRARRGGVWALTALGIQDSFIDKNGKTVKLHKNGRYDKSKWGFLYNSPFKISEKCCDVMKKKTVHDYQKKHNLYPIIATLTEESLMRERAWIQTGCNAFDAKDVKSTPMAFWTEQDVLRYIQVMNIPIASIYGKIATICNGGGATNLLQQAKSGLDVCFACLAFIWKNIRTDFRECITLTRSNGNIASINSTLNKFWTTFIFHTNQSKNNLTFLT